MQVDRAIKDLGGRLGRSPTVQEVSEQVDAPVEEVLAAMEASTAFDAVSLETPRTGDDDSGSYADTVGADDAGYELVEYTAAIAPAMNAMPPRDRLIMKLRFERDLTQSEIAQQLGISQMHVSRIIRRSLTRLRSVAEAA